MSLTSRLVSLFAVALALVLAGSPAVFAAGKHDHTPKHGGIVVEVKDIDLELVLKPDLVRLYVRDHGKPVKLDGASAKLTLLTGNEKLEANLVTTGGALEAKGDFKTGAGVKAVVVVSLPGKPPLTARFAVK